MSERTRRDRGQTTQDYAIGVGLFLLVVIFALTFLPAILSAFETVDPDQREAQAERIADALVDRSAIEGERVHLNGSTLSAEFADLDAGVAFNLSDRVSINARLESLADGTTVDVGGPAYDGQSGGSWTRLVTTDTDDCRDGCRLVVRVW